MQFAFFYLAGQSDAGLLFYFDAGRLRQMIAQILKFLLCKVLCVARTPMMPD
jgi:hypothetical protein